jgi:hypothetical protein
VLNAIRRPARLVITHELSAPLGFGVDLQAAVTRAFTGPDERA